MPDYELVHHGIKGMKWGVRRFQNKDGSLTLAGRARQKIQEASDKRKAKKAEEAEEERRNALMRKPISKLTDAEIAERYARREKERRLLDMENQVEKFSREPESILKRLGSKALNDVAIPALIDAGKSALTSKIKSVLLDSFGLKNDLKVHSDSNDDPLQKARSHWESLGKIATNKRLVANWNRENPNDTVGDFTDDKTTSEPKADDTPSKPEVDSTPSKPKADDTPSKPKADDTPSKPKADDTPSKPKADDTPSKPKVDATPSGTSNGRARSVHDLYTEGYRYNNGTGAKNTNAVSVSNLYSGGYRMTRTAGKNALDEMTNAGWTMRSLDDLEKYI